jgi:rhodanese-related sulfurtransferase
MEMMKRFYFPARQVCQRYSISLVIVLVSFFVFVPCSYSEPKSETEGGKKEYRSPESVAGAITTSVDEAKALYDQGVTFIDVRNPRFYAKGHIPGAYHLDFKYNYDEAKLTAVADRGKPIVIYCSGVMCSRSYRASASAVSWGFETVHYFRGGIADWEKAGYPIEQQVE